MISYVNVYSNILLSVLYLCSYVLTLDLESLNIHHAVKKIHCLVFERYHQNINALCHYKMFLVYSGVRI